MAPLLTAAGPRGRSAWTAGCSPTACSAPWTPRTCPGLAVDLRDVTAEQLAGFDAVVHLAALSNDPLGSLAPEITYDINHHASTRLARLAKEAGVAALRSTPPPARSTAPSPATTWSTRTRRCSPVTPYAESKVRVEDDLLALADDDFVPVSLRNATAFGFSPAAARRHRAEQPGRARAC